MIEDIIIILLINRIPLNDFYEKKKLHHQEKFLIMNLIWNFLNVMLEIEVRNLNFKQTVVVIMNFKETDELVDCCNPICLEFKSREVKFVCGSKFLFSILINNK